MVTAAVFARVLTCDFINYDDVAYVTENETVQKGLTWEGLAWAFGNLHGKATYWHPVTWMSHMLDCQVFGLNPAMHHLGNLVLHTANAVLLFLVLAQMTDRLWESCAVALLFALHPLQVDTVAWVTERKNVLSVFFALLCLGAYTRYARTERKRWYAAALALFAVTLMCKPALVILPGVLLLLDHWPLGRLQIQKEAIRSPAVWKLLWEKGPFVALSLASAAITILGHESLGIVSTGGAFSLSNRVQNAIVSYGRYLMKTVWPTGLTIHYPHPGQWPLFSVIGDSLFLIVLTILAVMQLRRRPWILTGLFWFIGGLVPAIGIIQVGPQAMAERFMYFPIIGLGIAVVWTTADLCEKFHLNRRICLPVAVLASVALSALTVRQIGFWKNSKTLWEHALQVTQWNYIAENNLALELLKAHQTDLALEHARAGALLNPHAPEIWCQLGNIYKAQENWPVAITNYQKSAELNPKWLDIPLLLAQAFERVGETSKAIEQYRRALALDPDSTVALNNLAWILATDADPRVRNGAEAVRLARRLCELTHEQTPMYIGNLAAAYAENGQFDEAVRTAGRAAERARARGDQKLAERNLELQQLYARQKAFHRE